MNGHKERITGTCISHKAWQGITCSYDRTVKVWALDNASHVKSIMPWSRCHAMADTLGNSIVYTGHYDRSIKMYSLDKGEKIHEIQNIHEAPITSLSLDPNNNLLLTAAQDHTCRVIDLRMNLPLEFVFKFRYYEEEYQTSCEYSHACFGHNGKSVIAGGRNGHIYVWNINDGKISCIRKNAHSSYVTGCFTNPTGSYFTTDGSGKICLWK